jgi:hypothetical protein
MGKTFKAEKSSKSKDPKAAQVKAKEPEKEKYNKHKDKKKWKGRSGGSDDARELSAILSQSGLTVHIMDGDGNCLFRSIADQVAGDAELHMVIRSRIMRYIKANGDHFRLFMEDDEDFDAYIERMEQSEEWGGHQELYAASQCLNVNITVYQLNAPVYVLEAAAGKPKTNTTPPKEIRLSYHGDCHYNSVRKLDTYVDASVPPTEPNGKHTAAIEATAKSTSAVKSSLYIPDDDISTVLQSVPWLDRALVMQALELKMGDVDAAIEHLCADVEAVSLQDAPKDETIQDMQPSAVPAGERAAPVRGSRGEKSPARPVERDGGAGEISAVTREEAASVSPGIGSLSTIAAEYAQQPAALVGNEALRSDSGEAQESQAATVADSSTAPTHSSIVADTEAAPEKKAAGRRGDAAVQKDKEKAYRKSGSSKPLSKKVRSVTFSITDRPTMHCSAPLRHRYCNVEFVKLERLDDSLLTDSL